MSENVNIPDGPPLKPPRWARLVFWPGLLVVLLMFESGVAVWYERLALLLADWGMPDASGAVSFPVMFALFGILLGLDFRGYAAVAAPVARGILWGAAFFLATPAAMVLLHFIAPQAVGSDWAWAVPLLSVSAAWFYFEGYRRNQRELEAFMANMEDEARESNGSGQDQDSRDLRP